MNKNNSKTLIVDCDGVLYPSSQVTMFDFLKAMKATYRDDLQVDGETQSRVSAETIAQQKLGMFNYIKAMCDSEKYDFDEFCNRMFDRVDYSKIFPDETLGRQLIGAAKQDNVVILTNNHRNHLDRVLQHRFGKTAADFEALGIKCIDITQTEKDGVFYPKQDPKALRALTQTLGVRPEDCTLLDDTSYNVDAARRIGMNAVLIDEKNTLKNYLTQTYSAAKPERAELEHA
jgi:FMN phosphatase YigB (HAD superfamily)